MFGAPAVNLFKKMNEEGWGVDRLLGEVQDTRG